MSKYYNLVYAKHHSTDRRAYLYSLPMDSDLKGGEKLYVQDRGGKHIVSTTSPNFFASETMTKSLCENNGGYFPPAEVVGTVDVVTVRQEMVNLFSGEYKTVEQIREEDQFPWL